MLAQFFDPLSTRPLPFNTMVAATARTYCFDVELQLYPVLIIIRLEVESDVPGRIRQGDSRAVKLNGTQKAPAMAELE